jgi:hypothetical protein
MMIQEKEFIKRKNPMCQLPVTLFLLLLSVEMATGQTRNENLNQERIDELAALPKDSLIKLATERIANPSFNKNDFDRVEAWATGSSVFIKFSHIIQVVPQKGRNYFSVTVDLLHPRISYSELGGAADKDEIEFYKPNDEDKKKIEFVRTAINNSNGQIGKLEGKPEDDLPNGTMSIDEKDNYYQVYVDSPSTSSRYKIDKSTMKIFDDMHRHKPYPGDNDSVKKIF